METGPALREARTWLEKLGVKVISPGQQDYVHVGNQFILCDLTTGNQVTAATGAVLPELSTDAAAKVKRYDLWTFDKLKVQALYFQTDGDVVYVLLLHRGKQHAHTIQMAERIREKASSIVEVQGQLVLETKDSSEAENILHFIAATTKDARDARPDLLDPAVDAIRVWHNKNEKNKYNDVVSVLLGRSNDVLNRFLSSGVSAVPEVHSMFYAPVYNVIAEKVMRHSSALAERITSRTWSIMTRTLPSSTVKLLCDAASKKGLLQLRLHCEEEVVPKAVEAVYAVMWRRHYNGLNDTFHWITSDCHPSKFHPAVTDDQTGPDTPPPAGVPVQLVDTQPQNFWGTVVNLLFNMSG
jgi:hypothetical protein